MDLLSGFNIGGPSDRHSQLPSLPRGSCTTVVPALLYYDAKIDGFATHREFLVFKKYRKGIYYYILVNRSGANNGNDRYGVVAAAYSTSGFFGFSE